jgi:glycosyltransferase involved in cell wall biosynthesis
VSPPTKLGEVVFAHDYPFLHASDGQVYSDRGDWPWHRYLEFAERMTIASRAREVDRSEAAADWTLVSAPALAYEAIPSLSGPVLRYGNRRDAARRLRAGLESADALIARLPSEIGGLAVRVAERLGKPWAAEVVTCTWDALWNYGTWQGKAYAPVSWWTTRRLVRRAPFVMYVTRQFLQRRYPTRGRSVGCSDVELPELDPAVLERRLARGGSQTKPLRIGMIAALTVRFKGVQTALAALGRIRERVPPFEFHVLGAGDAAPWRELARRHGVDDCTHFPGTLAPEAVHEWLDGVDVYLQPSFQEGLPRALVEACSRACPALGSTAGGIPELLAPECLHKPGDDGRLAELLAGALTSTDWRRRQAELSFAAAQPYRKSVLDRIRAGFWAEFAAYAKGSP